MKTKILIIILIIIGLGVGVFFVWKNISAPKIGEQVTIPQDIENNCVGFVPGDPSEARMISEIGGAWMRVTSPFAWGWVELEKGNFDFYETDRWVKGAQEYNVAILAII